MDQPLADFTKPTAQLIEWTSGLNLGTALDVGSYKGRNALYLARQGWDVTAIDNRQESIDALKTISNEQHLNVTVVMADLLEFTPEQKYDLVLCQMVLHFLLPKQIRLAFERLQTWTKSGGYCLVTAFTDDNPVGTRPYLFRNNELKEHFKGWNIERYEETYGEWAIPKGKIDPEHYMSARIMAQKPC